MSLSMKELIAKEKIMKGYHLKISIKNFLSIKDKVEINELP